jgi:hypothetical protein
MMAWKCAERNFLAQRKVVDDAQNNSLRPALKRWAICTKAAEAA